MAWLVGAEIAGYAGFGWVSDRLGRRPAFTLFGLVMACGLVPLSLLWDNLAAVPFAINGAMVLVGFGTGTWSNFGPMLAELFPTQLRNGAMGMVFNLARAVQFGAPVLVAMLEPRYGLSAGLGLAAVCATGAAALVWSLPETRAFDLTADAATQAQRGDDAGSAITRSAT
jgi:dipeptide/tripeptide permease